MSTLAQSFAVVAILTNGIVYGTEVFAAIVQRSALAHVDDRSLTAVMGYVHHYAGQRLSPPGMVGLLTAIVATVLAAIDGSTAGWIAHLADRVHPGHRAAGQAVRHRSAQRSAATGRP